MHEVMEDWNTETGRDGLFTEDDERLFEAYLEQVGKEVSILSRDVEKQVDHTDSDEPKPKALTPAAISRPIAYNREFMAVAKCQGIDPEVFYPDLKDVSGIKAAKLICSQCFVQTECLTFALDIREENGVWGGMTAEERRKIAARRSQRIA